MAFSKAEVVALQETGQLKEGWRDLTKYMLTNILNDFKYNCFTFVSIW